MRSIINHLDYIKGLGMTGIMLTPFYKTAAYHGYHVANFEKVDPHFGTKEDVKELVSKVHERNMIIVADFVANHCHISCKLFDECMDFPNRCIVDILKGYGPENWDYPDPRCAQAPPFIYDLLND